MIYELRTYDLKAGSRAEVEKRFGEAYRHRRRHSEMAAFWHTEIGPLNQVVHLWPYQDLAHRARVRAEAIKDGTWPPPIHEFMVSQRAEIFIPAPFSPEIRPGNYGPYYEMRTYTYAPGSLRTLLENWEKALPPRLALSPLLMCGYSELGGLNKWMHIWPYTSLNQRIEIRDQARKAGVWPTRVAAAADGRESTTYVTQETRILVPSAFSPVQ